MAPPLSGMEELRNYYRLVLEDALARMDKGKLSIRIPRSIELYRRIPETMFHATAELFFQTGGGTDFKCPSGNFRLTTHQLCVMPRGVSHGEIPIDLRTPYSISVCMRTKDGISWIRAVEKGGHIVGSGFCEVETARGRDAFRYLDEIAVHESVSRRHRKGYVEGLMRAYLVTMLDELEKPTIPATSSTPLVAESEKFIRANLSNPALSVSMLARTLSCSTDHLSRIFHHEKKITLAAWISQERIAMARDFLASRQYNISEIGWACGFNSPAYFIRVFREHLGITPRRYREELRA